MDKFRPFQFLFNVFLAAFPLGSLKALEHSDTSMNEALPDSIGMESITVTATKQSTDLLSTPLPISAFEMKNQIAGRFEDMSDVSNQVPGLSIGNTGNSAFPEIFIRGVGTRDSSVASDPSVGFYIDDVYIGRGMGMFTDLFDLERVEVLKGPQGVLWGRNTLGGAIHLITSTPNAKSENRLDIDVGNYSNLGVGALYNLSLSEKTIGRISFNKLKRDGYSVNTFDGSTVSDVDNINFRASFLYRTSERSDWLFSSDYTQDRSMSAAFDPLITGSPIVGGLLGDISVVDAPFNHIEPDGNYLINNRPNARENRDIYGVSGKYEFEGNYYRFTSITAFREVEFDNIEHNDGLSIQLAEINQLTDQRQFSQEFRLYGDSSSFSWILGGYYFNENTVDSLRVESQDFNLLIAPIYGQQDFSSENNSDISSSSYAIFGNLQKIFAGDIKIDFGLRYSKEYKKYTFSRTSNDVNQILLDPSISESRQNDNWGAFSPSATFSYQPQSDAPLYYASISRGFRSGGYNSLQSIAGEAFSPEFLTAYQAGIKSNLFKNLLRLDVSTFYYDHSDMQVQTLITQGAGSFRLVTTNAAEATEKGIDLRVLFSASNYIDLDLSLTVLDATYDKFVDATGTDVSGNYTNLAPEISGTFGLEYGSEFRRADVRFRIEYLGQSKVYFTETNTEELAQPHYSLVNAFVEISPSRYPLTATIYGKNLTNKSVINTAIDFGDILGTVSRVYDSPRTYGLKLNMRF